MREVKSSIVGYSSYTVVADPKKLAEAKRIREHNSRLQRERVNAILEKAAGVPVVRETNFYGPCIWRGLLVRETDKFYVYADRCLDPEKIPEANQKRISKAKVHLATCQCCEDHPQTHYPVGNEN